MKPDERRQAIIDILCQNGHETMKNLASEFGVSIRTICYDIEMLSLTYPLFTLQGRCGGVYLMEEYRLRRKYLMPQQQELLERLASTLIGEDLEIMLSILRDFALKGADKALQHLATKISSEGVNLDKQAFNAS